MTNIQEERLLSLDEDMPGDEPASLQDGVMRMLRLQDNRSYSVGKKDGQEAAEAKYEALVEAARSHAEDCLSQPTCTLDKALRQLGKVTP